MLVSINDEADATSITDEAILLKSFLTDEELQRLCELLGLLTVEG
jgi:hypothetical protein